MPWKNEGYPWARKVRYKSLIHLNDLELEIDKRLYSESIYNCSRCGHSLQIAKTNRGTTVMNNRIVMDVMLECRDCLEKNFPPQNNKHLTEW